MVVVLFYQVQPNHGKKGNPKKCTNSVSEAQFNHDLLKHSNNKINAPIKMDGNFFYCYVIWLLIKHCSMCMENMTLDSVTAAILLPPFITALGNLVKWLFLRITKNDHYLLLTDAETDATDRSWKKFSISWPTPTTHYAICKKTNKKNLPLSIKTVLDNILMYEFKQRFYIKRIDLLQPYLKLTKNQREFYV